MARKPRTTEDAPFDPYTSVTQPMSEIIDTTAELVNPSPLQPSAVERDGAVFVVAPPPKYRVMRQALVMNRGARVLLRPGKLVDEANYDVPALMQQGVELERT